VRYPCTLISSAVTTVTDAGARVTSCENLEAVDVTSISRSCSIVICLSSGGIDCASASDVPNKARAVRQTAHRACLRDSGPMTHLSKDLIEQEGCHPETVRRGTSAQVKC